MIGFIKIQKKLSLQKEPHFLIVYIITVFITVMWWSEILAKTLWVGFEVHQKNSASRSFIWSAYWFSFQPAAEVLNHFPGNRESHTKCKGKSVRQRWFVFPSASDYPENNAKIWRRRAGALWQAQNSKVTQTGETSFPVLCSSGFPPFNQMM